MSILNLLAFDDAKAATDFPSGAICSSSRRLARTRSAVNNSWRRALVKEQIAVRLRVLEAWLDNSVPDGQPVPPSLDQVRTWDDPPPRRASAAGTPGLTVPEWRVLFPPDGRVPREALCRRVLATGETGSGKTASCILPVVAPMAKAPRERVGAALIVHPKREFADASCPCSGARARGAGGPSDAQRRGGPQVVPGRRPCGGALGLVQHALRSALGSPWRISRAFVMTFHGPWWP